MIAKRNITFTESQSRARETLRKSESLSAGGEVDNSLINSESGSRMIGLRVQKLFYQFDYNIQFSDDRPILVLTAPNGFGKSTILRIINSFAQADFDDLATIPCESIVFSFENDLDVKVVGDNPARNQRVGAALKFYLLKRSTGTDMLNGPWIPRGGDFDSRESRLLLELAIAERLSTQDLKLLRNRTAHGVQRNLFPPMDSSSGSFNSEPAQMRALREGTHVRFISVQRLNNEELKAAERGDRSKTAISRIAQLVSIEIERARALYGERTREQEKTFVRRVVDEMNETNEHITRTTLTDVIERIQRLEEEYQRLALVEPGQTPQLGTQSNRSSAQDLLVFTYLEDIVHRFDSLSEIASRLALFLDTANEFLQRKSIALSREEGFVIVDGLGRPVPINKLSSGEQHVLVLLGLLAFDTDASDLILIDEPEISLHPAWQEKFLGIVEKIVALNDCKIIMATHSPLLINGQWDLVVELAEQG
jgi:energy-coupling factor transporter ATP-binding protein EcfA2